MLTVKTYQATIYCGFRPAYKDMLKYDEDYYQEAKIICKNYCNNVNLCVTLKKTEFIYKEGDETGIEVGLINYPRFAKTDLEIRELSINLAKILKDHFQQLRVSVVFSDETILLGEKV